MKKKSLDTIIHTNTMHIEQSPVIAEFFNATNIQEFASFLYLFTADAHVNHKANNYYGAYYWRVDCTGYCGHQASLRRN